jgi:hypothetical protein
MKMIPLVVLGAMVGVSVNLASAQTSPPAKAQAKAPAPHKARSTHVGRTLGAGSPSHFRCQRLAARPSGVFVTSSRSTKESKS